MRWLWYWAIFFLLVQVVFEMRGGTNPASRFALLAAMSEDHSIRIDAYHDLTVDWARTPDGHYYSNKAPGPALVAFAIFYPLDRLITRHGADRAARDGLRIHARWHVERWLSILLQAVPFALLVIAIARTLLGEGISPAAVRFFLAASFFGSTAAMYFNTYFGHGMTAVCALAAAWALRRRRYAWCGFAFGMAVLCDFGSAMLLPALLAALAIQTRRPADWARWAAGGILPGIAWVWYHVAAFGSPFTLPTRFQNPLFVDSSQPHLWGVIDTFPHPTVVAELLFGPTRGLLFTQPWVLVALIVPVAWRRREAIFALGGLAGLLTMNAAFGQWHAGNTPGPRYLSAIFPVVALSTALAWDRLTIGWRRALSAGLTYALLYYAVVMSTTLDAEPGIPLWVFYAHHVGKTLLLRGPILLVAWWWLFRRNTPVCRRDPDTAQVAFSARGSAPSTP